MAKAFGPVRLVGTLDDLNFYMSADGNIARVKGKTGNTKKSFRENPIFTPVKEHSKDFGHCAKKGAVFRRLVKPFYDCAKDGSIAGRSNQLLHAIIKEDTEHKRGQRQLHIGLRSAAALDFLVGFEGNKGRPLVKVLKRKVAFNWIRREINLKTIHPLRHLDWPDGATHVHLQLAISNWNCEGDTFETSYSNAIVLSKEAGLTKLVFEQEALENKDLWLAFIHIRFSSRLYNSVKVLPNKWNTTTLIGCRWGSCE